MLDCKWVYPDKENLGKEHLLLLHEHLHTAMPSSRKIRSVFRIFFCLHAKGLPFPFSIGNNISHWRQMSIQEGLVLHSAFPKINKLWVYLQAEHNLISMNNKLNWQEQKIFQPFPHNHHAEKNEQSKTYQIHLSPNVIRN